MTPRVLLLEDDVELRGTLELVLEDEGFEVCVAGHAEEALAQAQSTAFDLIVADVRLPGINGIEAVHRLRQQQPEIKTMVVTGYASEADSIRAIQVGVHEYLRKPFREAQFVEAVRRLLAQRRQAQRWAEREGGWRRALIWALERTAPHVGLARMAWQLARDRGMSEEGADEVQIVALATLAGGESLGLPAHLRTLVEQASERWDGQGPEGLQGEEIPLASRLAALAVRWAAAPGPAPELDPALVEQALRWSKEGSSSRPVGDQESRARRGLLSLAKALPAEEARAGFRRLAEEHPHSREAVEACLSLAQLEADDRVRWAERACALARAQSPLLFAPVALEVGLLLQSESWLEEAGRTASTLQLEALEAHARLALLALRRVYDQPQTLAWLAAAQPEGPWVLPFLQGVQAAQPSPAVERMLARLVSDTPTAPTLRLLTLGPLEVHVGTERIPEKTFRNRKAVHMLALLSAQEGKPMHEDVLIDLFWPDDAVKGRNSLNGNLSAIRKGLRPAGWEGPDPPYLLREGKGVRLNPEMPIAVDLVEFEAALQEASAGNWRRALSLVRGHYAEDCYMDWALLIRERVERQVRETLNKLGRYCLEQGLFSEALDHGQKLVELDACSQDGHLIAMRAQLGLGQAQEAERQFKRCERALRQELAMEPSIELLEVRQRALLSLS